MKYKFTLRCICFLFLFISLDVNGIENGIYCDKYKHIYLVVCNDEFIYINYLKYQDLRPLRSIARGRIIADSCYLECYKHKRCNLDVTSPLYDLSPFCDAALQGEKIHYSARHRKIRKIEIVYRLSNQTDNDYIKMRKVDSVSNLKIKEWINKVVDTVYYQEKMKWIEPLK